MKKIILVLLLSFILVSCGGFEITKNVSESNPNVVTYSTPRITVKSEYEVQTFYTEVQFSCYKENNKKTYSIAASYIAREWPIFEKIIFNIDGVTVELIPDRPPVRDMYNLQGPRETITVQVPEETIINIYESIDTKMTVKGMNFQYDVVWNEDLRIKLYEFYKATLN